MGFESVKVKYFYQMYDKCRSELIDLKALMSKKIRIVEQGFGTDFFGSLRVGTKLNNYKVFANAIKSSKNLKSKSTQYITAQYSQNGLPFNRIVAACVRRKFFWL
jgi:hypothetical protein